MGWFVDVVAADVDGSLDEIGGLLTLGLGGGRIEPLLAEVLMDRAVLVDGALLTAALRDRVVLVEELVLDRERGLTGSRLGDWFPGADLTGALGSALFPAGSSTPEASLLATRSDGLRSERVREGIVDIMLWVACGHVLVGSDIDFWRSDI